MPVSECRPDQNPLAKSITPRDDVRRGDQPKLLRPLDTGEQHEVPNGVLVSALRIGIADILEPLNFRRNLRQSLELRGRQKSFTCGNGCTITHPSVRRRRWRFFRSLPTWLRMT